VLRHGRESRPIFSGAHLVEVLTWSRCSRRSREDQRRSPGRESLPIFPATVEVLRPGRGAEDQRPSLVEVLTWSRPSALAADLPRDGRGAAPWSRCGRSAAVGAHLVAVLRPGRGAAPWSRCSPGRGRSAALTWSRPFTYLAIIF